MAVTAMIPEREDRVALAAAHSFGHEFRTARHSCGSASQTPASAEARIVGQRSINSMAGSDDPARPLSGKRGRLGDFEEGA
jgi:hypothetical protein